MDIILQILTLLGAVTLFLFGLSLISNGLQKVAGDGMRRILAARTAISHTIMNTVGVVFVLIIYPWFLQSIGWIVELFGLPNPNTADLTLSFGPEADAVQKSLLYSVCVMHTLFNVVITLIFVWFVPSFVNLLCRIFPSKNEEKEHHLQYISGGPLSTAELSLDEAKQEISKNLSFPYHQLKDISNA